MDSFIFLVKLIKFNELFFIYFVRYFLYVFTYLDSITVLPRSFSSRAYYVLVWLHSDIPK